MKSEQIAMLENEPSKLAETLARQVESETYRQVKQLEVDCEGDRVTVRGRAKSFHAKQLVTRAVLSNMPHLRLNNAVQVYS